MSSKKGPSSVKDWSNSFWINGWYREKNLQSDPLLCFETGYYGLKLNLRDLTSVPFGILNDDVSYTEALSHKHKDRLTSSLVEEELIMEVQANGKTYRVTSCKAGEASKKKPRGLSAARLWEVGVCAQHYDLLGLVLTNSEDGSNLECDGVLDIVAWPNSWTVTLKIGPVGDGSWTPGAKIRLKFKDWKVEGNFPDGVVSGKTITAPSLHCDFSGVGVKDGNLKVYNESKPGVEFKVLFNDNYNCYISEVKDAKRSFKPGFTDIRDYDTFHLTVDNRLTGKSDYYLPFMLHLIGMGLANPTGVVPILCDNDTSAPTGTPMQISKNWHGSRYLRAFVLLPVPASATNILHYKIRVVYGFYGSLPSASHANLCLVGWNDVSCGRWEQLAIGCWGETYCMDMDFSATQTSIITDVRALMVKNAKGGKWGWTDAGWGGDWLYVKKTGTNIRLLPNKWKTAYVAQGPCLTKVDYAGVYGAESQVDVEATVMTLRTNDYIRVFTKLRYTWNATCGDNTMYLFKMGTTPRCSTPEFDVGNNNGLLKTISIPSDAKYNSAIIWRYKLSGPGPWWVAFPKMNILNTGTKGQAWRALIIRSFSATINNKTYKNPFITLQVKQLNPGLPPTTDMWLAPPSGLISTYNAGTVIDFEVEWITIPHTADAYYGENEAFRQHLQEHPNSWQTVFRESKGNNLNVQVTSENATVVGTYPIVIHVTSLDENVVMEIQGGVGAVPVEIRGLDSENYQLTPGVGDHSQPLDQEIHGNDYYQVYFDARKNTYSLFFNLLLDGLPASSWVLSAK